MRHCGLSLCGLSLSLALFFVPLTPTLADRNIPLTPQEAVAVRTAYLLDQAGKAARQAGDPVDAITDLRRAVALAQNTPWYEVDLAVALEDGGKREEALTVYRKAFGIPIGSTFGGNDCFMAEALTRYGLLCEDMGQQPEAVQCYRKALEWAGPMPDGTLFGALDGPRVSPAFVRAMLNIMRGVALDGENSFGRDRSADALAAFDVADRLAPDDPRPPYFSAYGFRHAECFAEAEAALRKVAPRDPSGSLQLSTQMSLELIHDRQKY